MSDLIDAAERYLVLGLRVIALTGKMPNGKVHRHGLKDAFFGRKAHWAELPKAFSHPATTGIGILTSWPLVVVDIDGEEGAQAWRELVGDDFMPDRWVVKTSRGLHLYLGSLEPVGSMKLDNLLDFRGVGAYVAAPPSLHPDGSRYEWLLEPDDAPLIEVPQALAERIRAHNFDRDRRQVRAQQQKRIRHEPLEGGKLWATWGFDAVIRTMAEAPEGQRNAILFWAACTLAEEGAVEEDVEQLRAAALSSGLTPLEVRATMRSARRTRAT